MHLFALRQGRWEGIHPKKSFPLAFTEKKFLFLKKVNIMLKLCLGKQYVKFISGEEHCRWVKQCRN